ncbi:MAG: molybdopterin molybdotransferase MoeA [Longimicrobiales bacterium]
MSTERAADWIDADEALARVLAPLEPLETEEITLDECDGRVLAEDVHSPIDQPAWDNSGMDGFAVRAEDIEGATADAPRVLRMIEDVPAGAFATRAVGRGEAIRIMTGAPVPEGADSVVRVEHTRLEGDSVRVLRAEDAGRNIRPRAEDLRQGDVAVRAGSAIRAAEIGVLAMVGATRVRVYRRPLAAILSTGDELVEPDAFDEVLAGRRIANSNGPMLAAMVRAAGGHALPLGVAADTVDAIDQRIGSALGAVADVLVISAGASMGEHDLVKDALDRRAFRLAFWRARVRPGSPLAFGTIPRDNAPPLAVFSLPGNPVSALVTCELFMKPALRRLQGRKAYFPRIVTVRLGERVDSRPGLLRFLRVRLDSPGEDGLPLATLTGPQGSGVLTSAVRADALLMVPEDVDVLEAGSTARAVLLSAADDAQEDGRYVD